MTAQNNTARAELEALEVKLLLEGIYHRYGFDFRDYSYPSIRRRLLDRVQAEKAGTLSGLQNKVLHDPACMERVLVALTVHVTAMFRDPDFYNVFRTRVVPLLLTYPFVRIWHAGCSTGEEVYSMAILLQEEGLYDRCRIYATDLSDSVLRDAKAGVFPLTAMKAYTNNYLKAGGKHSFSKYYTAGADRVVFLPSLREHVVFAQHNLVTDGSINEFNVILCRNVMIYFNRPLQDHVQKLLYQSLCHLGVLGIGRRESLRFTPHEACYEELDGRQKLFQMVR